MIQIFRAFAVALLLAGSLSLAAAPTGQGQAQEQEQEQANLEFRQYPGRELPRDALFLDERGVSVRLGDYFSGNPALPVIIVPGYFRCQMLCSGVADGLIRALQPSRKRAGRDFRILFVSIDPAEDEAAAQARRRTWLQRYGREGAEQGCAWLRGSAETVAGFSQRIGFAYRKDAATGQFAHPAGFLVAGADGRISRYFFGVAFSAGELDEALKAAARNATPSLARRLLLLCFRDPAHSERSDRVIRAVRYLSFGTLAGLLVLIMRASRANLRRREDPPEKRAQR